MSLLILTRYHGPTNTRGARVSAIIPARGIRVTVPFDDSKDRDDSYERVAQAALDKFNLRAPTTPAWSIMKDPNDRDRLLAVEYDKRGPAFIAGVF